MRKGYKRWYRLFQNGKVSRPGSFENETKYFRDELQDFFGTKLFPRRFHDFFATKFCSDTARDFFLVTNLLRDWFQDFFGNKCFRYRIRYLHKKRQPSRDRDVTLVESVMHTTSKMWSMKSSLKTIYFISWMLDKDNNLIHLMNLLTHWKLRWIRLVQIY